MTGRGANQPLLLGVTGNIACGKSAVVTVLASLGAAVIDADVVYNDLVQPGMPLLDAIVREFSGVIRSDGALDRRALGAIVFSDPTALAKLDDLVRPVVGPEVLRRAALATTEVVAIDAVKLFESGLANSCHETWVVACPPNEQLRRLMERNGFDREEANRRISAQAPQADKIARADVVIDNGGAFDDTERQVLSAFDAFLRRHRADRAVVGAPSR